MLGSEHMRPNSGAALVASGAHYRANSFIQKLWQRAYVLETGMQASCVHMAERQAINRRCLLLSGISFGLPLASASLKKDETVYQFATRDCDIRMSVEFYDRYSSNGFWFEEHRTDRQYCLSAEGEQGHNCLAGFSGSIAIVRYRIRSRSRSPNLLRLREDVRSIDRDSRLSERPPFERMLNLQHGLASDIQAFGYGPDAAPTVRAGADQLYEPWCLFRQNLYLEIAPEPFLVIHWKHALSAIRILDIIPGDGTRLIGKGRKEATR